MSIIPVSSLSTSELTLLGNNIRPAKRRGRRGPNPQSNRRVITAVNRALLRMGERIDHLSFGPKAISAPVLVRS